MMKQILAGTAAVAAMALVTPAMANPNLIYVDPPAVDPTEATVDINVTVQQVAILEVTDGTGNMVIDDPNDTFMGNASSGGPLFGPNDINGTADLAFLKLSTNFDIQAIQIDFPRTGANDVPAGPANTHFGIAVGQNTSNELGVWPQAGWINATGNINGGGGGIYSHNGQDNPLLVTGKHRQNDDNGFENGIHDFGLGVSTSWNRTVGGSPTFAAPDTYTITLEATIIPAP